MTQAPTVVNDTREFGVVSSTTTVQNHLICACFDSFAWLTLNEGKVFRMKGKKNHLLYVFSLNAIKEHLRVNVKTISNPFWQAKK